jgi:hypothetical protein
MVIATTAATAGMAGVSSATTNGGIINTLLKVAFIIAILGLLILGYMWVTGVFSIEQVLDDVVTAYKSKLKSIFLKYTPVGWAISAGSGVLSLFMGRLDGVKLFSPKTWI